MIKAKQGGSKPCHSALYLGTYLLSKSPQKNSTSPRRKMKKSLGSNPEINKDFCLIGKTNSIKHYRIKDNVDIIGQLIKYN